MMKIMMMSALVIMMAVEDHDGYGGVFILMLFVRRVQVQSRVVRYVPPGHLPHVQPAGRFGYGEPKEENELCC